MNSLPDQALPALEDTLDASTVRRIGIVGDVHTEAGLLVRALDELGARGAELILCVGDIADGPGDLLGCCQILHRRQVPTVRGNHDRWLLADLSRSPTGDAARPLPSGLLAYVQELRERTPAMVQGFLAGLPTMRRVHTLRGPALLCHGLAGNDMAFVAPDDTFSASEAPTELLGLIADPSVRLVFNGHSHRRMVKHFPGLTVVNAGTLHPGHDPGVVLLDMEGGDVTWLDFAGSATHSALLGSLDTDTTCA